jgi:hypothetical protein
MLDFSSDCCELLAPLPDSLGMEVWSPAGEFGFWLLLVPLGGFVVWPEEPGVVCASKASANTMKVSTTKIVMYLRVMQLFPPVW